MGWRITFGALHVSYARTIFTAPGSRIASVTLIQCCVRLCNAAFSIDWMEGTLAIEKDTPRRHTESAIAESGGHLHGMHAQRALVTALPPFSMNAFGGIRFSVAG